MKILQEALNSEPILKYFFLFLKYLFLFLKWFISGLLFGFGDSAYTYANDYNKRGEAKAAYDQARKREEVAHHRLGGQLQWEQDHPR